MTNGTVHRVQLHRVFVILIARRERIGDVRSMTLHRRVDRAIGETKLPMRRFDVGLRRNKAEQGGAQAAEYQNYDGYDYAEQKLSHHFLHLRSQFVTSKVTKDIVADEAGGA